MRASKVALFAFFVLVSLPVQAQTKKITPTEAKSHVGEKATVCGTVASARYVDRSKGQPTFLNLDEPYPKQIFTIVIWSNNRAKFDEPEKRYRDKRVCVTGTIKSFRETPEIEASEAKPGCTPDEYLNYKRAIGAVVYEVFERILEPLYLKHPELRPPEMDERSPS
jgi:RecG-like helicase